MKSFEKLLIRIDKTVLSGSIFKGVLTFNFDINLPLNKD